MSNLFTTPLIATRRFSKGDVIGSAVVLHQVNVLIALIILQLMLPSARVYAEDSRAAKIKAGLVFYVMKFIDWPLEQPSAGEQNAKAKPLRICIVGRDAVTEQLEEVFRNKSIQSRATAVEYLSIDQTPSPHYCNAYYFSNNALQQQKLINELLKNESAVVTICEGSRYFNPNCMVQIFEEGNKARLAIDKERGHARDLLISSELLALAEISTSKTSRGNE